MIQPPLQVGCSTCLTCSTHAAAHGLLRQRLRSTRSLNLDEVLRSEFRAAYVAEQAALAPPSRAGPARGTRDARVLLLSRTAEGMWKGSGG